MIPNNLVDYNLPNMKWKKDSELGKSIKGDRKHINNSVCYVTENKDLKNKYVFFSWNDTNFFVIELTENDKSIFYEKYPTDKERDFDLDCKEILGFDLSLPKVQENSTVATLGSVNGMGSPSFPGNPETQSEFGSQKVGSGDKMDPKQTKKKKKKAFKSYKEFLDTIEPLK